MTQSACALLFGSILTCGSPSSFVLNSCLGKKWFTLIGPSCAFPSIAINKKGVSLHVSAPVKFRADLGVFCLNGSGSLADFSSGIKAATLFLDTA